MHFPSLSSGCEIAQFFVRHTACEFGEAPVGRTMVKSLFRKRFVRPSQIFVWGEHKLDLRCVSTVHRLLHDTLHHLVNVHDDVSDKLTR